MSGNRVRGPWMQVLLPPLAFQGVVIGGGYATGRELVEFFGRGSVVDAMWGMGLVAVLWSLICAGAFVHAHSVHAYDYRTFFRSLLGRGWVLFEIAYGLLLVLILSVLGAAAGEISAQFLHVEPLVGTVAFVALTVVITWWGSRAVELLFSAWSPLIYLAFAALFIYSGTVDHSHIREAVARPSNAGLGWVVPAITYAGYNLAVLPAVLPTLRSVDSGARAMLAGLLVGPLAMVPAVLLFGSLLAVYPEFITAPVPILLLLQQPDFPGLLEIGLGLVIFGTLVQTSVGVLHSVNERLAPGSASAREKWRRATVALVVAGGSIFLADQAGLITLIAQGYGSLAWAIFALTAAPLMWVFARGAWARVFSADQFRRD